MSAMFEIDENSLPFVKTRHALIAIDLQNDFISPEARIPVLHPPNLVDSVINLASNFRSSGNVIWVRTVFDASRPVNVDGTSESVITDAELSASRSGGNAKSKLMQRPSKKILEQLAKLVETSGESSEDAPLLVDKEDQISETYLTVEPGQNPLVVSQSSTGTNFPDSVARAMNGKKDLVFQKTYYSAFKDGSLVQTLRAKFVTEIYLCGALTNISVYATAMDAARHGYAITIVEDCLGYRSKARHDESLRKLVEFTGCDVVTSTDLIRDIKERERASRVPKPLPRRNPRPNERPKANISDLHSSMASVSLKSDSSSPPGPDAALTGPMMAVEPLGSSESPLSTEQTEELKLPTRNPSTEIKRERVKTKIKSRRRHSKSSVKETATIGEPAGSSSIEKSSSAATSATSIAASQESEKGIPVPSEIGRDVEISVKKGISGKFDKEVDTEKPQSTIPDISRASLELGNKPIDTEVSTDQKKEVKQEQIRAESVGLEDEIKKMAKLSMKEERSDLCEGDTTIVENLLGQEIVDNIFEKVRDEVRWQKMSHQGGDVPRLVAVQGEIGEDGSIPIYRHPSDESPPMLPFSQAVSKIRRRVEDELGHSVNHVLIQFYRDGNDYISEHSDKTLDIVAKTFIANVSLGAQRTMVFRTKKPENPDDEPQDRKTVQPRQAIRTPLPHNSMCKMGLVTNMRWLHGIRQDKRSISEKSAEELAFDGGRISLTFRSIGTFLSKDQTRIWGQGATSKSKPDAKTVINGNDSESEKMISAFGKENRASKVDWEEHYGAGYDVLHNENSPKLFLSGDKIADLRVRLMLAELGIEWTEGKLSPAFHWKVGNSSKEAPAIPEILSVKFVDNDLSKSNTVGDRAIMLYLDAVYSSISDSAARSQPDLARTFTRFQQSGELESKWRDRSFSVKPFRREMETWDAYAAEGPFIAGEKMSLADYALWPLLDEIQAEWDDFDELENLAAYYKRLKESSNFPKVLGAGKVEKLESRVAEASETKEEIKPVPADLGERKANVKKELEPEAKLKKTT